jgi:hypothetical protein
MRRKASNEPERGRPSTLPLNKNVCFSLHNSTSRRNFFPLNSSLSLSSYSNRKGGIQLIAQHAYVQQRCNLDFKWLPSRKAWVKRCKSSLYTQQGTPLPSSNASVGSCTNLRCIPSKWAGVKCLNKPTPALSFSHQIPVSTHQKPHIASFFSSTLSYQAKWNRTLQLMGGYMLFQL